MGYGQMCMGWIGGHGMGRVMMNEFVRIALSVDIYIVFVLFTPLGSVTYC